MRNPFRFLFPKPPPAPEWTPGYESRLHTLEVENRDLKARVASIEAEHRALLAPEITDAPAE